MALVYLKVRNGSIFCTGSRTPASSSWNEYIEYKKGDDQTNVQLMKEEA